MRLSLISFLYHILEAGTNKEMSFLELQKTKMFNLFILLAFPFAFFSLLINIILGLSILSIFSAFQLIIFLLAAWTNITRKQLYLRPLYLFLLAIVGLIAVYFFKTGTEYRLLVMIIAAVVLFDKNWQYLLFATIISVGFTITRIQGMAYANDSIGSMIIPVIKILIPITMFNISIYYFKYIYFKSQMQLETAFKELSLAKEQKDKILNSVAHDLRSPISSIVGISKVLLHSDNFTNEQREWLHYIEKAASNSNNLITDLLQSNDTAINLADLKKQDLNPLIKKAVDLLHFKASEKNILLNIEYCPTSLIVLMDGEKLLRVFINLISNAIKFSNANSVVLLRLYHVQATAIVSISDTGIGIKKEHLAAVFDMFTTVKRAGTAGEKSFGLGLSICKQIVEHHSGSIQVESEVGKGSVFYVHLPTLAV